LLLIQTPVLNEGRIFDRRCTPMHADKASNRRASAVDFPSGPTARPDRRGFVCWVGKTRNSATDQGRGCQAAQVLMYWRIRGQTHKKGRGPNPVRTPLANQPEKSGTLLHDLVRYVARHRIVMMELHGERRAPLGHRPQVGDVAEHLLQRHVGPHYDR
jgi:hypothetical protein